MSWNSTSAGSVRAVAAQLVAHLDEHQLAGAAFLGGDVVDRRACGRPRRRRGSARGTRTGCRPTCGAAAAPAAGSRRAWRGRRGRSRFAGASAGSTASATAAAARVPVATGAAGWSRVAVNAATGVAPMMSCAVSLRPIHAVRSVSEVMSSAPPGAAAHRPPMAMQFEPARLPREMPPRRPRHPADERRLAHPGHGPEKSSSVLASAAPTLPWRRRWVRSRENRRPRACPMCECDRCGSRVSTECFAESTARGLGVLPGARRATPPCAAPAGAPGWR